MQREAGAATENVIDIKLISLVEDDSIYPREAVDKEHVERIAEAMAAGATIPPIVVDAKTLRIVDGRHRFHAAYQRDDLTIRAILRDFATEADVFLAAVQANSSHGRFYEGRDTEKVLRQAEILRIPVHRIAEALMVTVAKVASIQRRVPVQAGATIAPSVAKYEMASPSHSYPRPQSHRSIGQRGRDVLVAPPTPISGNNGTVAMQPESNIERINKLTVQIQNGQMDYREDRITYALHALAELIRQRVPKHPPSGIYRDAGHWND